MKLTDSTDVKRLTTQRFLLAIVSVVGLIAAGVGVFLALSWGKVLDAVTVGLLTLLIRELGGGKASAFAWFFDGSADKPPPTPGTSTTTASALTTPPGTVTTTTTPPATVTTTTTPPAEPGTT